MVMAKKLKVLKGAKELVFTRVALDLWEFCIRTPGYKELKTWGVFQRQDKTWTVGLVPTDYVSRVLQEARRAQQPTLVLSEGEGWLPLLSYREGENKKREVRK